MTQDNEKPSIGLSPTQVAGSALAAVSAALFASFAGTAGTIIGAALGSVVATVGSATYTWWLRRTSTAVRRTAAQVRATALVNGPQTRTAARVPMRKRQEPEKDTDDTGSKRELKEWLRSLPWGKVVIASVAVAVVSLGSITALEAITGKPMSAWVGADSDKGTSVGHLVRPNQQQRTDVPGQERSPSSENSDDRNDSSTSKPSPTPSPTSPTPTPTPAPATPDTPDEAPADPSQEQLPPPPQNNPAPGEPALP